MEKKANTNKVNKYYGSTVEWRDYEFFLCDGEKKEEVTKMLTERGFLLPSGKPNKEKITEEAKLLADKLALRLSKSDRARHFGLANIAAYTDKFNVKDEQVGLYFYMIYLYGSVLWRVPYNVQRLAAAPAALSAYLEVFAVSFAASLNDAINALKSETEAAGNYEQSD